MAVRIYVDSSKQVGALEPHLKVCQVWQPSSGADGLLVYQIDANGFRFSGLLIDTNFKADGLILCNLIALAQCRHVEENVAATIVWFDETEALILVEHLNFAGWHAVPQFLIPPFLVYNSNSAFVPAGNASTGAARGPRAAFARLKAAVGCTCGGMGDAPMTDPTKFRRELSDLADAISDACEGLGAAIQRNVPAGANVSPEGKLLAMVEELKLLASLQDSGSIH
jgi:hypothetical protein